MSEYRISEIRQSDTKMLSKIDSLLQSEGLIRDSNLDYICAIFDDEYRPICTGSLYHNTLRCFAVDHHHQGEGLLNQLISHLIQIQYERGNLHLFLYTKINTAKFFRDLGFYEIAVIESTLVFMENQRDGFEKYLTGLRASGQSCNSGCIVMNANPFTLGHQYLVEYAAANCEHLHIFIVSEDSSLVPFSIRKRLVAMGTSHLQNISIHDSGPYIISNATFPSYFLKDEVSVIKGHARLDIQIFLKIAEALHITKRFVGEEPKSMVTSLYNQIMADTLPNAGIECRIIPRRTFDGQVISASTVRSAIKKGDFESLKHLVPTSTLSFFLSDEAKPIIDRIQNEKNVIHY